MSLSRVRAAIRDVPDFPREGILFKDITPVLGDPSLFREVIDHFAARHASAHIAKVACVEARGFTFGSALALQLGAGIVPVRKKGKLPSRALEESYALEYGTASIEIHADALQPGERVLLIDDLLATGGTAAAAVRLIERLGAHIVEIDFLIELSFLRGRDRLPDLPVYAPIVF